MDIEGDNEKKQIRFIIVPDFIIDDLNIPDGEKLLFVLASGDYNHYESGENRQN